MQRFLYITASHWCRIIGVTEMYPRIRRRSDVIRMTYDPYKPIIGVTTKRGEPEWVEKHTKAYLEVLVEYGAVAIVLSPNCAAIMPNGASYEPNAEGRLPVEVLDHLDGLVLAGGGDVHPKFFGAEMDGANPGAIDLPRDELELDLSELALKRDLPIFGICRGCQVLNVAAGGGMIQHFDGHRNSQQAPITHDILIEPGSRLHQLVGVERLPSNTYHHQGLDHHTLADGFVPVGVADPDNWLVEAIESRDHKWVFGVQWHPERLYELDDVHRTLWVDFVATCRAGRNL